MTQYLTNKTMIKTKSYKFLSAINKLINWQPVERLLSNLHPSQYGRPAYPPLLMFKILLLQRWFNLSDPAAEDQINDRLSFKYFIGLPPEEPAPDETTIVKFRNLLMEQKLINPLFEEIERQCQELGLTIRSGTILDASLIKSALNPHKKKASSEENSSPDKDPQQETASEKEDRQIRYETFPSEDPEASWTVRITPSGKKVSTYGYKLHLSVDDTFGLIRAYKISTASDHDIVHAKDLLPKGKDLKIYADKAYWSEDLIEEIKRRGLEPKIMKRASRGKELEEKEKEENKKIGKIRQKVEKVFGIMKQVWGLGRTIYVGLERNELLYGLASIAFNLKVLVRVLSRGGRQMARNLA